jgi:hypothetical protein
MALLPISTQKYTFPFLRDIGKKTTNGNEAGIKACSRMYYKGNFLTFAAPTPNE